MTFKKGEGGFKGPHSEETKRKISETKKRLGHKPVPYERNPNVNLTCAICKKEYVRMHSQRDSKYCSRACYFKSIVGHESYTKGIQYNTPGKVYSIRYAACHKKVEKLRGTPPQCEVCGTTNAKRFEWANLTGNYPDVNDYKRMCVTCHRRYDLAKPKEIPGRAEYEKMVMIKMSAV